MSKASQHCPSITAKRVTAHTLRHTAAMAGLLASNDITVIALWLGHEQVTTTQIYLHVDMSHNQRAIERTRPLGVKPAVTGPATPCSRSRRPSDYADIFRPLTTAEQALLPDIGIRQVSA